LSRNDSWQSWEMVKLKAFRIRHVVKRDDINQQAPSQGFSEPLERLQPATMTPASLG
jgi:hypothetical protein